MELMIRIQTIVNINDPVWVMYIKPQQTPRINRIMGWRPPKMTMSLVQSTLTTMLTFLRLLQLCILIYPIMCHRRMIKLEFHKRNSRLLLVNTCRLFLWSENLNTYSYCSFFFLCSINIVDCEFFNHHNIFGCGPWKSAWSQSVQTITGYVFRCCTCSWLGTRCIGNIYYCQHKLVTVNYCQS